MLLLSYRGDRLRTSIILLYRTRMSLQLLIVVDQYSTVVVVLVNRASTIKYTLHILHQTNGTTTTAVGLQAGVTTVLLY